MADIALLTASRVEVVGIPVRQLTLAAGEDITAGAPVTQDASGNLVNADGNATAPLNTCVGIATLTVKSGEALTALQEGDLDGYALTAMAYGDKIYLSDTVGRVATGTGASLALALGIVKAVTSNQVANARNKVAYINIRPNAS